MTLSSPAESDRIVVAPRGEVDWDAHEALHRNLVDALRATPSGLDLRLDGVTFWDCAALGVLLRVREHAAAEGKTVVVRSASPIVHRVLELTGTLGLFGLSAED
ncbi:STAS domain-containing protein [Streptomyces sp. NPDC047002]|uniref:STAS domain-containing protein n=1 Tax=Streptomyces sp. NPDC047002 TaxID=3155475 RepID=UPI00345584F0